MYHKPEEIARTFLYGANMNQVQVRVIRNPVTQQLSALAYSGPFSLKMDLLNADEIMYRFAESIAVAANEDDDDKLIEDIKNFLKQQFA